MTVSADGADRISLLYEAAKVHGSLVSLNDMVLLMPEHVSEDEIEDAIRSQPTLRAKFALESGYVVEKNGCSDVDEALSAERLSRERASTNLRHAASFVPLLGKSRFEMIGASGSTSYRSASRSKDLDLFCVAPAGTLWISLTKALLLSRVFSLVRREGPPICLSCVMDENYAKGTFSADQGALFARDALETIVLSGEPTYRSLLGSASWISKIYPAAFSRRSGHAPGIQHGKSSSPWANALNGLLFVLAGGYISAKSFALNRRLAARGQSDGVFALRKGVDHMIYESRRYEKLRNHYSVVSRTTNLEAAGSGTAR